MARSRNMQKLTDQLRARYPGVVIYGIGDDDHQSSPSGHNEDDTPGSRPEEEDADSLPEHRAIDVMIGPRFSLAEARKVAHALVTRMENRRRLRYVILEQRIWRHNGGWMPEVYRGKFHNHVHASGWAADDDNTAEWIIDAAASPAPVKRRQSMSTLYYNRDGKEWALGGDSPGTSANWLTTREQAVANGWAAAHGNALELYAGSYNDFRDRYLEPLRIVAVEGEGSA